MSALTLFAIIFFFLLLVGGWISSEYVSHKYAKSNKKLKANAARLEKENTILQQQYNRQTSHVKKLQSELENLKEARQKIRIVEQEYKNLQNRYNNMSRGLEILRKTVTSKKYMNNSLAKEIILLLNEHLPDAKQAEMNKAEASRETFKRIKENM